MKAWLVMHFALGHWRRASSIDDSIKIVDSARLLNRKMFCYLFPESDVRTERLLLLPKSFIAVKN